MGGASSASSDNDVSGAEAVATGGTTYSSRKINTKKKPADYNPEKDDTAAKLDMFENQGATNIKNSKFKTPATMILSKPLQAGSKITRNFFTDKVLTSERGIKNIGYTKDEFSKLNRTKQEEVYKGYMSDRQSNTTDAYGNRISQSSGGNDNPILSTNTEATKQVASSGVVTNNSVIAPTNAEVTQAQSTDMSADQILVANKKKGRRETILQTASGLGDSKLQTTKKTLGA